MYKVLHKVYNNFFKLLFRKKYDELKRLYDKEQELVEEQHRLYDENRGLVEEQHRLYDGNRGLVEEIQFLKYRSRTLDELHESVVQGKWPHDGSFKTKKCTAPFTQIEILPRGEVYTCCSGFIKHNYFIGNIYTESNFDAIWNSEKVLKLRYSVANGNFEYCQKLCPVFHENDKVASSEPFLLPRSEADFADSWESCKMNSTPKIIKLSCDESCNLFCTTCRSKRSVLDKNNADALYDKLMSIVRPMLKDCEWLYGIGSGDLFASSACSRFYKTLDAAEFPQLSLEIITNLQLLTPSKWEEFKNLHDFPISFKVSVDGANKETYEENRRGASWETLCENLRYFKEWRARADNKIKNIGLNFIIQENNIAELEDFCRFAQSMGVDEVWFQQIYNWGTFSDEEFKLVNPFHKENPQYTENIQKLRSVLNRKWGGVLIQQNILSTTEGV